MSLAGLTPDDLARLRAIASDYFRRAGLDVRMEEWGAVLPDGATFGFVNPFQRAAELDPVDWEDYLTWHFDTIRRVEPRVPDAYELAAPNLRIRLADDDVAARHHPAAVRRLCDGLSEVLVVRFEEGCFTLPGDAWERWEVDLDTVWADALSQTTWDEPRTRRHLARGRTRIGWIGGGFFASSQLLDLGRYLLRLHRHGAVAAVPTADALLWAPVDVHVPGAAQAILELASEWWAEGPNAISPDLFWWRDGCLERIVEVADGRAERRWGEAFSQALAEVERGSAA